VKQEPASASLKLAPAIVIFHDMANLEDCGLELRRLLQRAAVRLELHLDIAARRLRVGANRVRFGDERFGLRLVDAIQLGVQRHVQENPAFVLVEVHGRGHLDVIGIQGDFVKARRRLNRGAEAGRIAGPE
jgi:hypothetical protein